MSELAELYQELIIDHGRNPRNFCAMQDAQTLEGFNPLCGDRVTLYLKQNNEKIDAISFQGKGCAISIASTSLMTEVLKGKTLEEVAEIFSGFHQLVTEGVTNNEFILNSKLAALSGVSAFPARVKCATLAWHTFLNVLKQTQSIES